MKLRCSLLLATILGSIVPATAALVACGDDSTGGTPSQPDSGGTAPDSSTTPKEKENDKNDAAGSTTDTDAGDAGDAGDASLAAPVIDTLKPNDAGTLTVTWENVQPNCDSVEGWRKDALDPYAVVFTVPGETTKKDDPGATANQNYTYRLRCKKGADYSPFSYELSANPHN